MRIDIITIFPEYFGPLRVSLIGKAAERGDIQFGVHDLRGWSTDVHRSVDDAPYGGGPGMVMTPGPWGDALDSVLAAGGGASRGVGRLVLPSPSGTLFTQERAAAYAAEPWLIFGCGRYEGIDSRVAADARTRMPVDEVSIGDYVLAGGEAGRAGDGRGHRPAAARGDGQRPVRGGRFVRRRVGPDGGTSRGTGVHPAAGLAGAGGAAGAAVGRSWGHCPVAA